MASIGIHTRDKKVSVEITEHSLNDDHHYACLSIGIEKENLNITIYDDVAGSTLREIYEQLKNYLEVDKNGK